MRSLIMALRSIGSNKMRSALTMLGIIIGVMALVVLVSLVNGATGSITNAVSGLGSSVVTVNLYDTTKKPVTLEEIGEWQESEPALAHIAPYKTDTLSARRFENFGSATVYGVTSAYKDAQALKLTEGRFISSADVKNHSFVCVINETMAEKLVGYTDCTGQKIKISGTEYTIIGVLESEENNLTAIFTAGQMTAFVPLTSLVRLSNSVNLQINQFYIGPSEGYSLDETADVMERILLERYQDDEDAYRISSQNLLEDAMGKVTNVLSILLGGIAAISLIVGGIGIMNIMMVTVTERTREIGIRKAIGASRGTILVQFLMEAVVLCMLGCGLGIFLSWGILRLVSTVVASTGLVFEMNGSVVVAAVVFCFLIGIIFGLSPANKAAKMKPIDALHYGG
ncbi:MAG: ABC transporter permease [Firmicutes bacterium]|nr:ABC transporter permease [Bacillota bacterium]